VQLLHDTIIVQIESNML